MKNKRPEAESSIRRNTSLRRFSVVAVAILATGIPAVTFAGTDSKEIKDPKVIVMPCEDVVDELAALIRKEPSRAAEYVVARMRTFPDCACEIAHGAIDALALPPVLDAKDVVPLTAHRPNPDLIAAVLRAALFTIYQDIPEARGCVRDLVNAATDAVGKDARAISRVLNAAIPVIASNDPRLAEAIIASTLPSITLSPSIPRLDTTVVEPNFTPVPPGGTVPPGSNGPVIVLEPEPPASLF